MKGASKSCEYPVAHQVRSADLDKAGWPDFTQKVALWPEYYMVPAQRMAVESEQRLEQVARRRVAIEQRVWLHWARETAYLLRLGRQTCLAGTKVEASLKEVGDGEARLRTSGRCWRRGLTYPSLAISSASARGCALPAAWTSPPSCTITRR